MPSTFTTYIAECSRDGGTAPSTVQKHPGL